MANASKARNEYGPPSSSWSDGGILQISDSSEDSSEDDSGVQGVRGEIDIYSRPSGPVSFLPRSQARPIPFKTQAILFTQPAYAGNSPQDAAKKMLADERRTALSNNRALIAATKENSIRRVSALIAAKVDVNRPDAEGCTALHYAAERGHFELTMALIEHDADKGATTREGYTAIMLAAKHRHPVLVEVLASYDIPNDQPADNSRSGTTPAKGMDYRDCYEVAQALAKKTQAHCTEALRHAVTHNDVPMAARLLATGKIALEERDEHGHTLLVLAASRGDAEMIRLLLCAGAGVDTVDNKGKAPLMHAAAKSHLAAIAALLHAGAIATRTDNDDESAVSQAICNDDTVLLGALLAGKAGVLAVHSNVSLLEKAASLGNQGTVRMLLASGADVPDANGSLMLAAVARQGKLAAFNTLLLAGADPHHRAWDGHTAFTLAAANGQTAVVTALIAHCPAGYSLKTWRRRLHKEADKQGRTALMLAVLNCKRDMADLLLKHGADPHTTDHRGRNAMLWAAAKADSRMVDLLIGYRATLAASDRQGNNVLMAAAENGKRELVDYLCMPRHLKSIFNIDTTNKDGDTPLIVAARNGHLEVVELLLEHGASVLHHNSKGRSALLESGANGHSHVLEVLHKNESSLSMVFPVMNHVFKAIANVVPAATMVMPQPRSPQTRRVDNAGNSMMHLLASNGHQPMLGMLLGATDGQADGYESATAATSDEEGPWPAPTSGNTPVARRAEFDIDIANKEGMTPLCLAARNGHYSTVKMLLEQGALVNHVSRDGMTPLWLACRLTKCMPENGDQGTAGVQMSPEMLVHLMLSYDAHPDEASFQGQTPLLAASATGGLGIVKQLIAAGANINHADRNGLTPLMGAAHSGHADVAAMLLNNGAAPDSRPGELSALVFAAESGHDTVVRLLIERGARTDRVDAYGSTALIGASAAGNASTVKLLIDKGANPMAKDRRGHDALYYAMKGNHAAVVMALQEGEPAPRDF